MKSPYPLRQYQLDAVEKFLEKPRGTISLPTGTGKTAVGLEIVRRMNVPTAIMLPRISLLEQWEDVIKDWGGKATTFYTERKLLSNLTLFVYNSATLHPKDLERFQFLIFDESQFLDGEKNRELLKYVSDNNLPALGLSATPGQISLTVLPIVYKMEMSQATEGGFVSPLTLVGVGAELTLDEREAYEYHTNLIRGALSRNGGWNTLMASNHRDKFTMLQNVVRRKVLMAHILDKHNHLREIAERYKGERVLVFSESIDAIDWAEKVLSGHGIAARAYHSGKDTRERTQILQQWGNKFDVLLSVRCLDIGIDIPEVAVGVIVASGKSDKQLIQRTGRLIRPLQGKLAKLYCIYAKNTTEEQIPTKLRYLTNAKYMEAN